DHGTRTYRRARRIARAPRPANSCLADAAFTSGDRAHARSTVANSSCRAGVRSAPRIRRTSAPSSRCSSASRRPAIGGLWSLCPTTSSREARVAARLVAFVAATEKQMAEWLGRDLSAIDLSVLMIDGVYVGDDHVLLVALGLDVQGNKHVL